MICYMIGQNYFRSWNTNSQFWSKKSLSTKKTWSDGGCIWWIVSGIRGHDNDNDNYDNAEDDNEDDYGDGMIPVIDDGQTLGLYNIPSIKYCHVDQKIVSLEICKALPKIGNVLSSILTINEPSFTLLA